MPGSAAYRRRTINHPNPSPIMATPTELLRRVAQEGGEIVSSREVATGPLTVATSEGRVASVLGDDGKYHEVVYRTAAEVKDRRLATMRE